MSLVLISAGERTVSVALAQLVNRKAAHQQNVQILIKYIIIHKLNSCFNLEFVWPIFFFQQDKDVCVQHLVRKVLSPDYFQGQ